MKDIDFYLNCDPVHLLRLDRTYTPEEILTIRTGLLAETGARLREKLSPAEIAQLLQNAGGMRVIAFPEPVPPAAQEVLAAVHYEFMSECVKELAGSLNVSPEVLSGITTLLNADNVDETELSGKILELYSHGKITGR